MKYAFITRYKKTWPVDLMCRLLGVNRNAYYRYSKRKRAEQPDPEHQDMLDAVKAIAESSGHSYGTRRMKRALRALGYPVSRQKARKLMREAGITVRYRKKYKVTTSSRSLKTCWIGSFRRPGQIKPTCRTSPMSGHRKAGCTWRLLSICSPEGLSAGAWVRA